MAYENVCINISIFRICFFNRSVDFYNILVTVKVAIPAIIMAMAKMESLTTYEALIILNDITVYNVKKLHISFIQLSPQNPLKKA